MQVESIQKGDFEVLVIKEDISSHQNPFKLKHLVADRVNAGKNRVAISLTVDTFISDRLIKALVACADLVKNNQGMLALIVADESKGETYRMLTMAHPDHFIIAKTLDDLTTPQQIAS